MSGCDLLAVFAHPDDESLLAGGTLAACAAAGLSVGIVSLTRGELGLAQAPRAAAGTELAGERRRGVAGGAELTGERARGAARVGGRELGDVRERELGEAAAVLGAAWARCLKEPDGELESVDRPRVVSAVRALVSAHRPRVVISFAAEGLYWHPDHTAVHEIVHEAVPRESVCEATWPRGLLADTTQELRRRGLPADVWGLDPEAFGAPAQAIAHELDVSPFLDVKLRALRCHRSQLIAGHALADLPRDLALGLLGREWLTACAQGRWLAGVVAGAGRRRGADRAPAIAGSERAGRAQRPARRTGSTRRTGV